VLQHIGDFFDLPNDTTWMDEATALLTPGRAGRAAPSPEQVAMLREHCHAALVLLERESSKPSSGNQFGERPGDG
jgi:hypothetical protein